MKNIISIGSIMLTCLAAAGQTPAITEQDTAWHKGGFVNINFSQVSLSNWAAGGESSISAIGLANLYINYLTTKTTWENSLVLGYGLTKSGDDPVRKFEDKIEFQS